MYLLQDICKFVVFRVKELKERLAQRTATLPQLVKKETADGVLAKTKSAEAEHEQKIVEYLDPRIRLELFYVISSSITLVIDDCLL